MSSIEATKIQQAKEAFKAGNWAESATAVTEALGEGGIVYSMFHMRARANFEQQDYKAALRDAQAMTAIEPSQAEGYLLQAKMFNLLQKYGAEVDIFQDGLKAVDPEDENYGLLEQGLHDAKKLSKSVLNDPKMMELFVLFDKDNKSSVDFKDVAIGLYQLTNNMGDAQRQAAALLLMIDVDDQRTLIYDRFAKLIIAMSAISGIAFEDLYEQLKSALKENRPVPQRLMSCIQVTQNELDLACENVKDHSDAKKTLCALSYSRTSKLFELWDADSSGTINFEELLAGLRKHQRAVTKNSFKATNDHVAANASKLDDVEKNALMAMAKDKDNNQELDKEEFAHAMSEYAELIEVDLHELIDFMCTVASQSDAEEKVSDYEAMYSDVTPSAYKSWTMKKQQLGGLGTIVDMCEEEEEEEDDF